MKVAAQIGKAIRSLNDRRLSAQPEATKRERILAELKESFYFSNCDVTISKLDPETNKIKFDIKVLEGGASREITEDWPPCIQQIKKNIIDDVGTYPRSIELTKDGALVDDKPLDPRYEDMCLGLRDAVCAGDPNFGSKLIDFRVIRGKCPCYGG
jgi:hypothetical protein